MALDIKQFAVVARATNALYYYVTDDTKATVVAADYFKSKDLSGNVKPGDIILAVCAAGKTVDASDKAIHKLGGSAAIARFLVTQVNTSTGEVVVAEK